MGLFDDLLGGGSKSTQNTTPVTPEATDVIVTSSGQTVTPASIDEMLNISAGNITAEMPSYTAQKAEQNTSPIIAETPMAPASLFGGSSSVDVVPVPVELNISASSEGVSPVIVSETTENPVTFSTENTTPIFVHDTEPSIISETIIAETPVLTENMVNILSESVVETPAVVNGVENSVADIFVQNEPPVVSVQEEKTENPTFDAFNFMSSEEITVENASASEISENMLSDTIITEKTVSSTADFIATSLAQLAAMKLTLNARKQTYLDQASEYRAKKEEFAQLEAKALSDSTAMDDEYARIETMEKYFQKQKDAPVVEAENTAEKRTTRRTQK